MIADESFLFHCGGYNEPRPPNRVRHVVTGSVWSCAQVNAAVYILKSWSRNSH